MSQKVESIYELLVSEMKLTNEELAELAREIQRRAERLTRVRKVLAKYKGIGKGVWNMDAQEHINQLRADDRQF